MISNENKCEKNKKTMEMKKSKSSLSVNTTTNNKENDGQKEVNLRLNWFKHISKILNNLCFSILY